MHGRIGRLEQGRPCIVPHLPLPQARWHRKAAISPPNAKRYVATGGVRQNRYDGAFYPGRAAKGCVYTRPSTDGALHESEDAKGRGPDGLGQLRFFSLLRRRFGGDAEKRA
ncbi:hypothetical protein [Azospirillum palustre]